MSNFNPENVNDDGDEMFELGNLTDVPDPSARFLVKPGKYEAVVVDVIQEVSKTGNPMFTWTFQLGPDGNDLKLKFWTLKDREKAWHLVQVLEALGLGLNGFTRRQAIGLRCLVETKNEEYNGKESSKAARIYPHPKGPKGPAVDAPF